jgi:Fe-S oxidoreductase
MNPLAMALVMSSLIGFFAWTARRRFALIGVGASTWESRLKNVPARLSALWTYAFFQKKMRYYLAAGLAHQLIFLGFGVLLLRSLMLWGRGFEPSFNLWVLGPDALLGQVYAFLKDTFAALVLLGVTVFVYYRVIRPQKRMSLSVEGLVILGIIATMMLADFVYDGASQALNHGYAGWCGATPSSALCESVRDLIAPLEPPHGRLAWAPFPEPVGSLVAVLLEGAAPESLVAWAHMGFWTHATLVLVFLNILPYSKHFHIITSLPNVFLGDLTPPGRLRPLAATTEGLMAQVEKASEHEDMGRARIGYGRIDHFSWKDILDFYTCTECGRCSDNCPAALTGKKLSPKHLTLDLRNHLYGLADAVMTGARPAGSIFGVTADTPLLETTDLVPGVVDPDVLWACTTCRACEEQCPVNITYVDKIVQMRRNLVTIRGDFPSELNKPFEGLETNGNPWNLSRLDRARWSEGLELPTAAERPSAEVLFWVGCAASYDDRAKKIARATAQLLTTAGVDFAILAEEESCTGDPARRAGNEYLFSMLAEANIATLRGYKAQGGVKKIITTCPHCFNTLKNEYPDFGERFEVVHHTDFLLGLLAEEKLSPQSRVNAKVAYHDSCYLGRYNGIYTPPREILKRIGAEVLEVERFSGNKGLCCGAGGAQMFMEEQNSDRVNVKRTGQLLDTGADVIASACPFCMTMLTDGLKAKGREEVRQLDVVELLWEACVPEAAE